MESRGKSPDEAYDDVYYDQGDGEFQPLSDRLTAIVSHEVERAIRRNEHYEHDYQQLSRDSWMLTGECLAAETIADELQGGALLREIKITSHELHRSHDITDKVQTIILAERQHASRVSLEMSQPSIGEVSEQYVTAWSEDRYIIERTDGVYRAYVEQIDMLTPAGDRQKRPMTLYDAAELIMQIEQLKIV